MLVITDETFITLGPNVITYRTFITRGFEMLLQMGPSLHLGPGITFAPSTRFLEFLCLPQHLLYCAARLANCEGILGFSVSGVNANHSASLSQKQSSQFRIRNL